MLVETLGILDLLVAVFSILYYYGIVNYISLLGFVFYLGLKAFIFRDILSIIDGVVGLIILLFILVKWEFLLWIIIIYFAYKLVVSLL